MTTSRLRWSRGGEAEVLSIDANAVVLRSTVPWPPGARVDGMLVDLGGAQLKVKVHGCRREGDGAYRIEGRPLDLGREVREKLGRDSRSRT